MYLCMIYKYSGNKMCLCTFYKYGGNKRCLNKSLWKVSQVHKEEEEEEETNVEQN